LAKWRHTEPFGACEPTAPTSDCRVGRTGNSQTGGEAPRLCTQHGRTRGGRVRSVSCLYAGVDATHKVEFDQGAQATWSNLLSK
jgi:hypothetical protein